MTSSGRWVRAAVGAAVVLALAAPAATADDGTWGVDLPRPVPGADPAEAAEVAEGLAAAPDVAAAESSSWTLSGSGWGHGVGMSQYGAYEMARDGYSAADILGHYYTGTDYERRDDDATARVNVRNRAASVTLRTSALSSGGGSFRVTVATGDGDVDIRGGAGDVVTVRPSGGSMAVSCSGCSGTRSATGARPTVRFDDDRTLLVVDGAGSYRDGLLRVTRTPGGSTLEAAMYVRVHDEYLDYIREVPWSWPAATLQAQAAAARGYVLRNIAAGVSSSCNCHVYDDTRSQVFGGYPTSSGDRRYWPGWTDAVRAAGSSDQGYVATYRGSIIEAYYSSSSGGRTQNSEDVWTAELPYLRSVDDRWAQRSSNPRAHWTAAPSRSGLASAFDLRDVVRLDLSERYVSGAVASATATSSTGATRTLSGESLRSRLRLNSTYVERPTTRLGGSTRYAVAAALARTHSSSARTVVVASGATEKRADAAVAGPLAQSLDAPLLLSTGTALPGATRTELARRAGTLREAVVVGGEATVSQDVVEQLEARGLTVRRISGADRYRVAANVALDVAGRGRVTAAVVASGTALADALGAGGPAGAEHEPVLLTRADVLPGATASALRSTGATSVRVLGGEASVSGAVVRALEGTGARTDRIGGADRYEVAAAVASFYRPRLAAATHVSLASGADAALADALTAGSVPRMTLLTTRARLPEASTRVLQESGDLERVVVMGGTASVSGGVRTGAARR
ncbi:SpoIID/LytB domain-containing protein [Phycicoccus sp. BSK3Z-2]|uniref:SpoIID/LytB domain-containing protein n=1 Tax=Phycicoccus avicenniae TaxID=2828860 RepID=A0A941I0V7_9MICO|nr:cell wall-binding repeat-containing protein [Phycicoccus avicenniae]MBR7743464.1 SpoIID/LytB domain-containing protein [Phycicoccus avicenniae]MBR7743948.1 SpoIID/LytB domain-containing protein [Phycicoccus avicenniae]